MKTILLLSFQIKYYFHYITLKIVFILPENHMEFVTNNPNNILTRVTRESQYTSTGFEISDEAAMLAKCQILESRLTIRKSRMVLTVTILASRFFKFLLLIRIFISI